MPAGPVPELADLKPMLLCERKTVPKEPGWHYEIKFDGYRVIASTGRDARIRSRNGADATTWFPELVAALFRLPAGNVLDGEVCILDEVGRSDFDRLHARARRRGWHEGAEHVAFCAFDLLISKGRDIRAKPIEQRKTALSKLLTPAPAGIMFVDGVDDGDWLYAQALALGLEGIVGKRDKSTYQAGERSRDWVKIKRPGAVPPERFKR